MSELFSYEMGSTKIFWFTGALTEQRCISA
jgi:hypothetical protein